MSRKSARIQGRKRKPLTEDTTEREIIQTFSRKRKAEDDLVETLCKKAKVTGTDKNDCEVTEVASASMEITQRRKQFQLQNQWVPISNDASLATCVFVPSATVLGSPSCIISPHKNNTTPQELVTGPVVATATTLSQFRFQNFFTTPVPLRNSPLPSLYWADSKEVWQLMLRKEQLYIRDPQMLERHSTLQPRMRSILLDWLIEVCEVYRLHRETYHLAVDFIDRFLSLTRNIQKSQLQLLGISALFVAAKLEEIYPPKLTEFAYVTDGACTETEILDQELVMLKALKWDLTPMTPNSWLNVFLQLMNVEKMEEKEHSFIHPQYSQHAFIQIARLLDLCSLDMGSLQFGYSVLATSATYHMSSEHVALSVSGYNWMDIAVCVQWMAPFATALREVGPIDLKFFQHIPHENTHNIQTHAVDMTALEKAQLRQSQIIESARASPDFTKEYPGIVTPPQSKGKDNKDSSPSSITDSRIS